MLHYIYRDATIYWQKEHDHNGTNLAIFNRKNPAMRPEIAQFTVFPEYVIYMLFLVVLLWESTHCEGDEAMFGNI